MPAITSNFKLQTVHCTLPQHWNDLTGSQCARCASIIRLDMPKHEQQMRLFLVLLDLKWYHFRQYITLWRIGAEARYNLASEATAFLYAENTRTKNPFPELRVGFSPLQGGQRGVLHGPSDNLSNITGAEFHFCENALRDFHESADLNYLREIVQILWRPAKPKSEINSPKWDGDLREPFNYHTYERRKKSVSRLTVQQLYAIHQFYTGARAQIIATNPEIFTTNNEQLATTNDKGWLDVFYSLAPNDDITTVESIANTRLLRTLGFLVHLKAKYKPKKKTQ